MSDSDNRYRLTLELWASQFVPSGAKVTSVEIKYDDGWDPTFTPRPASLSVVINYEGPTRYGVSNTDDEMTILTSIGELLTALFAIEESPL